MPVAHQSLARSKDATGRFMSAVQTSWLSNEDAFSNRDNQLVA